MDDEPPQANSSEEPSAAVGSTAEQNTTEGLQQPTTDEPIPENDAETTTRNETVIQGDVHIGDKHIHATGPVYNIVGPVTIEQHNTETSVPAPRPVGADSLLQPRENVHLFYDVADRIPNSRWNEFARRKLGLRESVIGDIEHDFAKNIREQKYRMILKWKETSVDTNSEDLARLCEDFMAKHDLSEHREGEILDSEAQHKPVESAATHEESQAFSTAVRQKCEELQSALRERVRSIASEESSLADFSERPITPVSLSIVSQPQRIDDEFRAEGHFRRREDLAKLYKRPNSDIAPERMFARAKSAARDDARAKFAPEQTTVMEEHEERHGNVVGIVGQPGIGKTTSAKKWALQGLSGRLFGDVSFFFYIVIRFIDFDAKMTFLQFLLHTMLPDWECGPVAEKDVVEAILADPNVLLIFDGLDEAAFHSFSAQVPTPSLYAKNPPELYLKNLCGGKLLSRARKIFTSRPAPFYNLHPSHRPRFIVQILGLTPNSQRELGRQICGDAGYGPVQEKLEQSSNLFAYCYVPVNFILTVHYLMSYAGEMQFVSLTRVLAFTCVQYSQTDHLKGRKCELDKLAKLAWDGFCNKKVVFTLKDFKSARIDDSTADAFLNTSVTKKGNLKLTILDGHKRRYFSHLIWQEFFAAVHLMMVMPLLEFQEQHLQLSDDRWEVVAKFAFGFCNRSVFDDLEAIVSDALFDHWSAKKSLLTKLVKSFIKKRDKQAILPACSWAYEANDPDITAAAAGTLSPQIRLQNLSLVPADYENLFYVIRNRMKPLSKLVVSGNRVRDPQATLIANHIRYFEEVLLRDCCLTHSSMVVISKKIAERKKTLKVLKLGYNKIGDEGAEMVGNCVHNVMDLDLLSCGITSSGAEKLFKKVKLLERPIKKLLLDGNDMSDAAVAFLVSCLHNIEELHLRNCGLTSVGATELCKKIMVLPKPMKCLVLSSNHLTDKCAESLVSCAHKVKELRVKDCGISQAGKDIIRSKSKAVIKF